MRSAAALALAVAVLPVGSVLAGSVLAVSPEDGPDERAAPPPTTELPALAAAQPTTAEDGPFTDPRPRAALERGLAYLATRQAGQEDGSLPQDTDQYVPVAVTALAALAWMGGGNTIDRGPHGREVARALDYLLHHIDLTAGSGAEGYVTAPAAIGKMHAHGFATLALSQAWTVSPDRARGHRIGAALEAGVRLIERTQGSEGGWWYEPRRGLGHENSITICLVQALRGARNAGVTVDRDVIARAIAYVKRTQNEDGAFRYALDRDVTSVGITAAAIATLNATGEYAGPAINSGQEWIWRRLALRAEDGERARFPHYERLYLAQALWQDPDPRLFERWWAEEWPRLIAAQAADGSFEDPTYGPCYATAMTCLVLAVPLGQLPILQR